MNPQWLDRGESPKSDRKLSWAVRYKDGSEVSQFSDGAEISSEKIDRANIWQFKLLDRNGKIIILQEFKPGHMFVYRCRNAMSQDGNQIEVIHIVGWRVKTLDGHISHICYVYESDMRIEMGDFRTADEQVSAEREWKYPINFRDIDEIAVK